MGREGFAPRLRPVGCIGGDGAVIPESPQTPLEEMLRGQGRDDRVIAAHAGHPLDRFAIRRGSDSHRRQPRRQDRAGHAAIGERSDDAIAPPRPQIGQPIRRFLLDVELPVASLAGELRRPRHDLPVEPDRGIDDDRDEQAAARSLAGGLRRSGAGAFGWHHLCLVHVRHPSTTNFYHDAAAHRLSLGNL